MAHELHELSHALWEICPLGSIMSHCSNFRTFPESSWSDRSLGGAGAAGRDEKGPMSEEALSQAPVWWSLVAWLEQVTSPFIVLLWVDWVQRDSSYWGLCFNGGWGWSHLEEFLTHTCSGWCSPPAGLLAGLPSGPPMQSSVCVAWAFSEHGRWVLGEQ